MNRRAFLTVLGIAPLVALIKPNPKYCFDDCLKEGTLIKTDNGYVPIEDVQLGDKVLTHTGRYMPVTNTIKKPFDNLFYKFKFHCQPSLEASYNHP